MFFNQPQNNKTYNTGRQNIGSIDRHNFSKRISSQKIDLIKREQLCKKCFNDKFFSYFYSNKVKCSRCKTMYKK